MDRKIKEYIKEHSEQIIADLCSLVRIPSVSDTDQCQRVLELTRELYEKNGFETQMYSDYLLSYYKNKEHTIGLFAHADVVEASTPWTRCENPFEPQIENGVLYGRGVLDNKSAIALSLYALKLIKEQKIPFNSTLMCFTGSNEESTMHDIKNYTKSHTPPDFSLVLDAGFPVYLGDKGMLWLLCTISKELNDIIDINGGSAINIILPKASTRIKYSKALYDDLVQCKELTVAKDGDEILLEATGISSHGAMPYGSKNAGGMLLNALLNAKSFNEEDKRTLKLLGTLLTSYDGAPLGINATDDIFGDTTVTNGILRLENKKISFSLDIRYGSTYPTTELLSRIEKIFKQNDISYEIKKHGDPSCVDRDNKYVRVCHRAYADYTGNKDAQPQINAGGTYSRFLPSSVETGTTLIYPDVHLPKGHGQAHQPDELISIDGLLMALELIVKMLIECDKLGSTRGDASHESNDI